MDGQTTLVATWHDGIQSSYNFRYSSPGGPEPQSNVGRTTEYRIYSVQPGTTYTLKIQGCDKDNPFSSSDCTPWDTTAFTVPMPMFGSPQPAPAPAPSAPQTGDPLPGGDQPTQGCGDACLPGAGAPLVVPPPRGVN